MNPYLFLEQGEYIMSRIAPLRGIAFFDDPDGDPFPMKELAASPLLARLDEVRFFNCSLSDDAVETFASSPHLGRCLDIDLRVDRSSELTLRSLEALAANPATRKCLSIQNVIWARDKGLVGELSEHDEYGHYYFEMSAEGHELERRYGYIPWLHVENQVAMTADSHYWVEHKKLPFFEPGSSADAPIPYGGGGRWSRKMVLPRADAAKFLADTAQ